MSSASSRPFLALALLASLSGLVLAQDGLPDEEKREVTEDMVRTCPDLKDAKGTRKAQLLALFFDLDWKTAGEDATRTKVRALFDLAKKKEDQELLEKYLAAKGAYRCQSGMRAVVGASGAPGLAWALKVFEKGPPEARGRLLDALSAVHLKEGWRFLARCLDDKTVVPDWKAKQEAPVGYSDLRVCDHALKVLAARLESQENLALPKEVNGGRGGSLTPVESRDAQIAALKDFLATNKPYAAIVKKEPALLDGLAGDDKKDAKAALERLGVAAGD